MSNIVCGLFGLPGRGASLTESRILLLILLLPSSPAGVLLDQRELLDRSGQHTSNINLYRVIVHDANQSIIRGPPTLYIHRALRAYLDTTVPFRLKKAGERAISTAEAVAKRKGSFICQTDPKTFVETAEKEGRWLHVRVEGCGHARSAKIRSAKTGYHMHLMAEVYIKAPSLRLFPPFLPSFYQHRTLNTTTTTHPEDHKDDKTHRTQGPQDQKDDKIHRTKRTTKSRTQGPKGRQNPGPKDQKDNKIQDPRTKRTTKPIGPKDQKDDKIRDPRTKRTTTEARISKNPTRLVGGEGFEGTWRNGQRGGMAGVEKWKNVEEWVKRRNGWERSRGGMGGVEKCLIGRTWKVKRRNGWERSRGGTDGVEKCLIERTWKVKRRSG